MFKAFIYKFCHPNLMLGTKTWFEFGKTFGNTIDSGFQVGMCSQVGSSNKWSFLFHCIIQSWTLFFQYLRKNIYLAWLTECHKPKNHRKFEMSVYFYFSLLFASHLTNPNQVLILALQRWVIFKPKWHFTWDRIANKKRLNQWLFWHPDMFIDIHP